MARSTDQVVEVIPLMDGEDSPRRVLCPWRVHPAASTLPAVARATAGRFVRCEWLVGRVVYVSQRVQPVVFVSAARDTAGRPSLGVSATGARESTGPPISRLSRTGEHLTQKPLAEPTSTHTARPTSHSHLTRRPAVARATAGKVLAGGCARQDRARAAGYPRRP